MADALKRISVLVTQDQYAALRQEATGRAIREGGKADASAIVRELLARWMGEESRAKRKK
jgi:hypothetical protein